MISFSMKTSLYGNAFWGSVPFFWTRNFVSGSPSVRTKCYKLPQKGLYAKECKALKKSDHKTKSSRRSVPVKYLLHDTKALVAQDRLGYDWSDQAEEGPINFALMAYTSSVSLNVEAYKAGLESIEARLGVYKKNEVIFEEDIKILKHDIKLKDNALTELRKKFEKGEKERDDLKLTLEKFENSSKNLSKLLEIQVNDKHKIGEGYHAVLPPYTGNFMPLKPNLILADEEEYVFSESKPKSFSKPLIEDWIL
ncbi:hypothetical protein Tco_0084249 [Tanacetum coccineum]